jgi:hypothetical protein
VQEADLRRRNGRPVGRHDLRLVRKDVTALGVHDDLDPMHVVVAIRLVVAERLDACKVLEPLLEANIRGRS